MEWMICGTVPDPEFCLVEAVWEVRNGLLRAEGCTPLAIHRGTAALMASTSLACKALKIPPPRTLLVGDTGNGTGSRELYGRLAKALPAYNPPLDGLTFHYLFPDVDGHNQILMAVEELPVRPLLVADAGFMYVAKMSGYAGEYDLFTPDVGEMAFLADEHAPHPFYTRGFLLSAEEDVPDLARRAKEHGNCARHLLVKGRVDHMAVNGEITARIDVPQVPAMEAMGGTGDLITGMVTALLMSGRTIPEACLLAAKANRVLGDLTNPTPATQVAELIPRLPDALLMVIG